MTVKALDGGKLQKAAEGKCLGESIVTSHHGNKPRVEQLDQALKAGTSGKRPFQISPLQGVSSLSGDSKTAYHSPACKVEETNS